jgi:hypothetical protein
MRLAAPDTSIYWLRIPPRSLWPLRVRRNNPRNFAPAHRELFRLSRIFLSRIFQGTRCQSYQPDCHDRGLCSKHAALERPSIRLLL